MSKTIVGGNVVQIVDTNTDGIHHFTDDPYMFFHGKNIKSFEFNVKGSVTLYVMSAPHNAKVSTSTGSHAMRANEVLQFEQTGNIHIESPTGGVEFFAAGSLESAGRVNSVAVLSNENIKKVVKPWGYEQWLTGEHPRYSFKKLFIKSGTKTSLQYHRQKRETMIFCIGEAALHYKANLKVENDLLEPNDISSFRVFPGHLIDVFPNHIHRVEAITDIHFFEVSTPFLDDVIRVSDDTNRANGRILAEHKAK